MKAPIAIVGMACRLPGGSNLEDFWELLLTGGNAVCELPADRLDRTLYFDPVKGTRGKTYSTLGGLVSDPQHGSDDLLLAPEKLRDFDPCHRNLCEVALQACRDAGYEPTNLAGKRIGVFVGHSGGSPVGAELTVSTLAQEAFDFARDVPEFSALPSEIQEEVLQQACTSFRETRPQRKPGGGPEFSADRAATLISNVLKLDGPAMSIDAACASSLIALTLGALAVQRGQVESAFVGGASWAKADSLVLFSHAQSASATASRPFDAAADGLIGSEGYVVLMIKSLDRAIADGDQIHAVIRGLGISSDGSGRSLWAPRKEGQYAAMERAYGTEVNPASIEYIEAHATSTQVGDATEMEALEQFFAPYFPTAQIPVGSVKSNIGHTLETAGLASLLKVVLAIKHGVIPPSINLKTPNPTIPWERLPFYVPKKAVAWPTRKNGTPRRAGINAFGIGGLNVHVIVDEHVPVPAARIASDRFPQHMPAGQSPSVSVRVPISKSSTTDPDDDAVAVIGRGVILPGASSMESLRELLESGRCLLSDAPPDRWRKRIGVVPGSSRVQQTPNCHGGYLVDYVHDWRKFRIPPKQIQRANPLQFMLLDATAQALAEAGYDQKPFDKLRTAVVIGSAFGCEFSNHLAIGLRLPELRQALVVALREHGLSVAACEEFLEKYEEVLLAAKPALLDETGSFTTSTLASRITKTFNLMGGALAIDAADCSSLAALDIAQDLLLSGECSQVICGTAHRCLDLSAYEALSLQGRLPKVTATGPNPKGHYFPGEGAAVLLLKRLKDARRDGDHVRAIIRGIGAGSHPGESRLAIESAIRHAGTATPTVMHWEFDGTASGLSKRVATANSSTEEPGCPTLASQIGYLESAHGLVAVIAATLTDSNDGPSQSSDSSSLVREQHGIVTRDSNGSAYCAVVEPVPQNVPVASRSDIKTSTNPVTPERSVHPAPAVRQHLEEVRPASITGTPARSSKSTVHSVESDARAMESTAVPAKSNSSPQELSTRPVKHGESGSFVALPPQPSIHILRIGASSEHELHSRLQECQANPEACLRSGNSFSTADAYRLAVVAPDAGVLSDRLKLALSQWRDPKSRTALEDRGIYSRQLSVAAPQIAVLFPGQGSQAPGMLRSLVTASRAARLQLEDADRVLAELHEASFAHLAWASDNRLDVDLWATQLSMLVADLVAYAALTEIGVRPYCVAGHSFGEYPAMIASGVCTLAQAIVLTRARTRAILESSTEGTALLAVSASADRVQALFNGHIDQLFLTHFNAPERTVVGGSRHALLEFSRNLRSHGIASQELPVPRAFHTPLMRKAQPPLREALNAERFRPPQTLLLSSVTNRFVADPEDIRDNLVAQLVEPVRYEQLVRRLVDEGTTILIEAGPRHVLTQLNRQILAGNDTVCLAVDHPTRPPAEQLACIQAALECAGVELREGHQSRMSSASIISPVKSPSTLLLTTGGEIEKFDATASREDNRQHSVSTESLVHKTISHDPVEQFDATTSRRERNRRSGGSSAPAPQVGILAVAQAFSGLAPVTDSPAIQPTELVNKKPHSFTDVKTVALQSPQTTKADNSLEQFLVDFIVEQTGYPPEVVELDADLEAELGIDSIRKAQLFGELLELGELGEFNVTSSGPMLRETRTLRQILELLDQHARQPKEGSAVKVPMPSPARLTESVADSPLHLSDNSGFELDDVREFQETPSQSWATTDWSQADSSQGAATLVLERSTATEERVTALARVDAPTLTPIPNLEKFLIDFVVEQTGYPEEVVELDADLEAELGIDSIRKAQLLGELREHVTLNLTESDRPALVNLRTLRQILELVAAHSTAGASVTRDPSLSAPAPTRQLTETESSQNGIGYLDIPAKAAGPGTSSVTSSKTAVRPSLSQQQLVSDVEDEPQSDSMYDPSVATDPLWPFGVEDNIQYQTAFQSGRERAAGIVSKLRRFADQAGDHDEQSIPGELPDYDRAFSPEERDKVRGLADGVGVHPANIAAYALRHNGTDSFLADESASMNGATVSNGDTCEHPNGLLERPSVSTPQYESANCIEAHLAEPAFPEPRTVGVETLTLTPACDSSDSTDSRMTWRHVLRMVPTPQWPDVAIAPEFHGAAVILGNNAVSRALKDRLLATGVHCHVIEPTNDPRQAIAALDRIWQQEPVPHLFVVTPKDADAATDLDESRWQRRRARGIMTPFWFCQRWLHLVQRDRLMDVGSIVCTTSLGGDFGFHGDVVAAESGALAGLLKAILIESWVNEFHAFTVKLIETPPDETPLAVVDAVWRESAVPSYDNEVAWHNGERSVVRALRTPLPAAGGKPIPRGGNWICTGGARGITAYVARQLSLQYGLKLNLLGTAPAPQIPEEWRDLSEADLKALRNNVMQSARANRLNPIKEWQKVEKGIEIDLNLRELHALGITARYHQCDVSNREELAAVLHTIRDQDGPIEGVLHGAGFGKDARFDLKQPENVDKCLHAKVDGAFALMDLTRNDPLKYFVAFSSISGRFGANGHTDYSAANDMLAKQIGWYRGQRPDVAAVAFHWHAWGDVGMATKPETRLALEMVNVQFMPAAEGLRHLIAELEAGAPEAEILITDEKYYRSFYPAETLVTEVARRNGNPAVASLPLLDSTEIVRRKGRTVAELTLDPTKEPFLIEHRLDDRPLLPLVIGLELMCEIATAAGIAPVGRLRNVEAVNGLKFHTDEPRVVRAVASDSGPEGMRCAVMSDIRLKNGTIVEQNRTFLEGTVSAGTYSLGKVELHVPSDNWEQMEYQPRGAARMFHGPALRCLRKLQFGNNRLWGRVVAPALVELAGSHRDVSGWMVPSAALDACLYATALLAWKQFDKIASLPHGVETLELGRRLHPGERCIVEATFVRRDEQFAWFDFVLVGMNSDVIVRATNYRVILMKEPK